ncbi:MAG: C-GCAxxG-C-C family protein [Candidatus Omnitrophota bacterium]
MRKEKAKNHYLGRDGNSKLNCAQSIIKAYHDVFGLPEQEVNAFAAFGGGRAPGGRCGAYYAACHLASKKASYNQSLLEREFLSAAGSLKCKEIRSKKKLTCLGCIEKATEFLEGGYYD